MASLSTIELKKMSCHQIKCPNDKVFNGMNAWKIMYNVNTFKTACKSLNHSQ